MTKDVPGQTYLADPGGDPPPRKAPRLNLTPVEHEVWEIIHDMREATREQVCAERGSTSTAILERLWRDNVLVRRIRQDGEPVFSINPEIDKLK